nr:hypothetical protein Iba_chr07dCG0220 [Ipomoea batatas]GMD17094.1 hypothetical protein Iba_chr07dCG0270 [Ipomoea batatas]
MIWRDPTEYIFSSVEFLFEIELAHEKNVHKPIVVHKYRFERSLEHHELAIVIAIEGTHKEKLHQATMPLAFYNMPSTKPRIRRRAHWSVRLFEGCTALAFTATLCAAALENVPPKVKAQLRNNHIAT